MIFIPRRWTSYLPNGFGITEAKEFALMLEEAGIDAHHVTAGIGEWPGFLSGYEC